MLSRPPKLSHLDTVQYEIGMLNYCYKTLQETPWKWEPANFVYLECFLLHYRNLIEFFGDSKDLKVSEWKAWSPRKLSPQELASISDKKPLQKHRGLISQYLQHCTKSRTRDRSWDEKEMYEELRRVLENFRRLFPVRPTAKPTAILSADSKSTASGSTATLTIDEPK
jgi:hypothetical protein